MESKKKNKRNKNKQAKDASIVASGIGKKAVPEPSLQSNPELNNGTQQSENVDSQCSGVSNSKPELKEHMIDESQVDIDQKLKYLENELNSYMLKEATLEKRVEHFENENKSFLQEKARHDVEIEELKSKTQAWILEEIGLKERIKILEHDKRPSILKEENQQLSKNISLLEPRIQLLEETFLVSSVMKVVMELEESRDILLQENQQLTKSISILESRIQQLENSLASLVMNMHLSEEKEMRNQIVPIHELAEVHFENREVVKKVNESHYDLDKDDLDKDVTTGGTMRSETDSEYEPNVNTIAATEPNESLIAAFSLSDPDKNAATLSNSLNIPDDATEGGSPLEQTSSASTEPNRSEFESGSKHLLKQMPDHATNGGFNMKMSPTSASSLDGIQTVKYAPGSDGIDAKAEIPLTDAPLIGAPFRLISFFAKYVSGADLVNERGSTSRR